MFFRLTAIATIAAGLTECAAPPGPESSTSVPAARPLDTLPAGADLALIRQDLLATAADRFGAQSLSQARAAPTYLIVKRFAGMPPPPLPGADPNWRPPVPAALLMKAAGGWMVAEGGDWRPARAGAAAELDRVLADNRFWSEPASSTSCPDYGAALLLLKVPGKAETTRRSGCPDAGDALVSAALRA